MFNKSEGGMRFSCYHPIILSTPCSLYLVKKINLKKSFVEPLDKLNDINLNPIS